MTTSSTRSAGTRCLFTAGFLLLAVRPASPASWLNYGGNPQHTGVALEALPAPRSV
jgi:hypothetical protein